MPSWVWNYYTKVDDQDALCNLCHKILKRSGGTKGLNGHLKLIHFITKEADNNDDNNVNKERAQATNKTSKPRKLRKRKAKMSDDESDSDGSEGEFLHEYEGQRKLNQNCYVCNLALNPCRYSLETLTRFTSTSVYELLESFTGATVPEDMKSEAQVCLECFVIFEKYDELQQQCKSIQNKLANFFHKTHSEKIFVKQEPEEDSFDDDSSGHEHNPKKRKKSDDLPTFHESFITLDSTVNVKSKDATISENFHCDECDKSFKTSNCLKIHIASDHDRNNGPVDCPTCLKTMKDRKALRKHLIVHSEQRNHLCGRCGATFVHRQSFKHHMMAHDDIRPYPCSISGCRKRFRSQVKLRIHLRVHTGEKIHECPHCPGKRFAQKFGMDLHIKNHHRNETEAAPSEICQICGVSTQTKSKMKIHMTKVHQNPENETIPTDED